MIENASEQLLVFTPYLTSLRVLNKIRGEVPLFFYTEFSPELFASGASSLRCLKTLMTWSQTHLFWLEGLHAKVIVADRSVLTLGSQNLTARGERNLEATAAINSAPVAQCALAALSKWQQRAIPITSDMITQMEEALGPLRKLYQDFRKAADQIAVDFKALANAEMERLRQRELEREYLAKWVKEIVDRLSDRSTHEHVSEQEAKDFVRNSAWWLKQRWGPCRSDGDARHVYRSSYLGYSVKLGANSFMVERAILKCKRETLAILKQGVDANALRDYDAIVARLKDQIFDYVANCNDEPFQGRYGGINGDDIVFGTHSIDARDFAEYFLRRYCGGRALFDRISSFHEESDDDAVIGEKSC